MTCITELSPVAIGGVGGSGTRVVAEILKRCGFFIGSDLNNSNDNLWFTLLLKRPNWFIQKSARDKSKIYKGITLFHKAMLGQSYNALDVTFLISATLDIARRGHDHVQSGKGRWAFQRALNILKARGISAERWGWKEPNTHIFLEYLKNYFPEMKYIHLIRSGLDMAYSKNQTQLFNWGGLFGVPPDTFTPSPKAALQYWIKANEHAIALGQELLGRRFLLVNFDRLCSDTNRELNVLLNFLEVTPSPEDREILASLVKIPRTAGRYKQHDLSVFSHEDFDAVRNLGFDI